MFVCELADGRRFLVKQASNRTGSGEASAYEAISDLPGLIQGIRPLATHDIAVIPFLPDAVSLKDAIAEGWTDFCATIRQVATCLAALDVRRALPRLSSRAAPFDFPYPECSQVLDCSAAMEELFAIVQDRALVAAESVGAVDALPSAPTHGDVKLDNILLQGADVFLVDWELFSSAPAGWSIASCVGMLFFALAAAPEGAGAKAPAFSDLFEAAGAIYCDYVELLEHHVLPSPDVEAFSTMVQLYMLEQIASGAMFKRKLDPIDLALIEVVERINRNRLYLA